MRVICLFFKRGHCLDWATHFASLKLSHLGIQHLQLVLETSVLLLELATAHLQRSLFFLFIGHPLHSFLQLASHFIKVPRELLDFKPGVFLLVRYFNDITLNHLNCIKFGLLKARFHLFAHLPFDLLNLSLELLSLDKERFLAV